MIKYALACDKAHDFESWFPSSDSFDTQLVRRLVACPVCGSTKVGKVIMAPQVARRDRAPEPVANVPAPAAPQEKEKAGSATRPAPSGRPVAAFWLVIPGKF